MPRAEMDHWIRTLQSVAQAGRGPIPAGLAPWFLAHRNITPKPTASPQSANAMLWQAVIEQATTSEPLTSVLDSSLLGDEPTDALAPMFAFSPDTAIEVWTERDLSSMHALHRLLIGRADPDLARRLDHAVDWHLDRTQPDNATGRPWAIGVFLMRWIERDDIECRLYAETLLHNCQMLAAKADPLSAEILLDAAEALEEIRDGSRS